MNYNFINNLSLIAAEASDKAVAPWVEKSFPIIKIVLAVLIFICSIFIIVSVISQKTETEGGASAITGQANTFYNRNKGESLQGKIKKWTIGVAIALMVLCVAFLIINNYDGTI